jgi:uncharacterized protein YrrD
MRWFCKTKTARRATRALDARLAGMPIYPNELRIGADVFSSDGRKLGELKHVVIKRTDLSVLQVVVDIGFLRSGRHLWEGGLGLDYDRVVGIDQVARATEDRVDLGLTAQQFRDAPEYSQEEFEPPEDLSPNQFDIADVANIAGRFSAALTSASPAWLVERLNRPVQDAVDIVEGTDVWRQHPHEKVGEVKRLLLNDGTGRLEALVVERGFVLHRDVILPVRYISELLDDIVRVEISDVELEKLQEFKED